jgi:hypothetical protein
MVRLCYNVFLIELVTSFTYAAVSRTMEIFLYPVHKLGPSAVFKTGPCLRVQAFPQFTVKLLAEILLSLKRENSSFSLSS